MSKKHFAILLSLGSSTLFAQTKTDSVFKPLDQVVVTATKYPVKQSLTGKVLTVIGRDQIEKSSGRQLGEVLNTQAGIVVAGSQNTSGSTQTVFLQGASAGKTLILIDGIPAYDPSGTSTSFDINLINTDEIERVEILKGSQSTLYGSDAVAGVINIITRKGGNKPLNASLNLAGGSYGTFKASAGIDGKVHNTSYNILYTHFRSDGVSSALDTTGTKGFDNDGVKENLVLANISQKINEALQLRGNFQYNQYKSDLDNGAFRDNKNYTNDNKNTQAGIGADYNLGAGVLHFNYNYNTLTRTYLDGSALSTYTGRSHYAELYGNFNLNKNLDLLAGVDYRNQRLVEATPYDSISSDSAKVRQYAAFVSVMLKNMGGFSLELGGRYNNFSKYGNVFTYSINPSYLINDEVKIFANLSSGFSAPTLYQLYSVYRNPSGDLKPERTLSSVEAGVSYAKGPLSARALYFNRSGRDNIIFYSDASFNSYYMNLDKQNDHGAELEASLKLGAWTFSGNYTYTTGKVTTQANSKDTSFNNLYRRPKNVVNLSAGMQVTRAFFLSTSLRTVGERLESIYGKAPLTMPSYYTWDAYAEYKVTRQLKAFADCRNLTNQQFSEIRGFANKRFNFMAGISLHL